jgi:hypothetical protein
MKVQRVPSLQVPITRGSRGRGSRRAILAVVAAFVLAAPAAADVRVHTSDEVLARWTVRSGDGLYFHGPNGESWAFITDINDPAILNRGQGEFFPVDPTLVQGALDAVSFPISGLTVEIYVLPYPRRDLIPSSASGSSIFLSPGVAPVSVYHVHSLVAHELGHVVHNQLLPDNDGSTWARYRQIRGIEDTSIYNDDAAHRNRPHEIFAEDFRYLFGGAEANYSNSIENPNLMLPSHVTGLEDFMLALGGASAAGQEPFQAPSLALYPNPARARVSIALDSAIPADGRPVTVNIFDVAGRLVARRDQSSDTRMEWDGRLDEGGLAGAGIYFVQVRRGDESYTGRILIAR